MSDTGYDGSLSAGQDLSFVGETSLVPKTLHDKLNQAKQSMAGTGKGPLPIHVKGWMDGTSMVVGSLEELRERDRQQDEVAVYNLQTMYTMHTRMVALIACELALRGYPVVKEDKQELARTV